MTNSTDEKILESKTALGLARQVTDLLAYGSFTVETYHDGQLHDRDDNLNLNFGRDPRGAVVVDMDRGAAITAYCDTTAWHFPNGTLFRFEDGRVIVFPYTRQKLEIKWIVTPNQKLEWKDIAPRSSGRFADLNHHYLWVHIHEDGSEHRVHHVDAPTNDRGVFGRIPKGIRIECRDCGKSVTGK